MKPRTFFINGRTAERRTNRAMLAPQSILEAQQVGCALCVGNDEDNICILREGLFSFAFDAIGMHCPALWPSAHEILEQRE